MILTLLYALTVLGLAIYSYVLIDPNITFFQHSLWVAFRDPMVQFGYYNREGSWYLYLILVIVLFLISLIAVKNYKKLNPLKLAFIIGTILLCSYPFLSHDFFNYMFDAKIFTFYYQNPYLQKALDYPSDQWVRFMHWTHRSYPYGPVFLVLSFIPSFLGFGKFALSFLLFKGFFTVFYIISVYFLNKLNKKWAVIFVTSPLVIIEGLISSHNDMVAIALGIVGVYFLHKKKKIFGVIGLLLSVGIKYITGPILLLFSKKTIFISFIFQLLLLGYMSIMLEIQPWYFFALFIFLPFYPQFIERLNLFFLGLLISYYPYIRFGGWDTSEKVNLKHHIIMIFLSINVVYLIVSYFPQLHNEFKKRTK